MRIILSITIILFTLSVVAQKSNLEFKHGLAGGISYANELYGDGGGGVRADFGYLTQLLVGRRLRGRVGVGLSMVVNNSKNNYNNILSTRSGFRSSRDTSFALRAGSFTTRFVALAIPLEYRFVSDGEIPWTAGVTYRPGFVLLKSVENEFSQYDWVWTTNQRLNETSVIEERPSISRFTEAISVNIGYETERLLLRLTIGRDQWDYVDDYVGGENRWLFGVEVVKWIRGINDKIGD